MIYDDLWLFYDGEVVIINSLWYLKFFYNEISAKIHQK